MQDSEVKNDQNQKEDEIKEEVTKDNKSSAFYQKFITEKKDTQQNGVDTKEVEEEKVPQEDEEVQPIKNNNEEAKIIKRIIKINERSLPSIKRVVMPEVTNNVGHTNYVNNNRYINRPGISTYVRPSPVNKGVKEKNKIYESKSQRDKNPSKIYTSKKPDNHYISRSPDITKRKEEKKEIVRGSPYKNIKITHIICGTTSPKFNIKEELSMDSINPIKLDITPEEREKLQKTGKTEFSASCNDNQKKIAPNLKGRTTVYQHARGIGMTNDKNNKINTKFYSSEIVKLDPIIKDKEKEKIEYPAFRSQLEKNNEDSKGYKSSRPNYVYNKQQSQNQINKVGKTKVVNSNIVRTNVNLNKSGNYGGDIVKEVRGKVQIGNRSQFQNQENPSNSYYYEKKVYKLNNFTKK